MVEYVKISELPAASSASGTDQIETNQGGTSRRVTVTQLLAVGGGAPSGPAGGDLAGTYPNPTLATDYLPIDGGNMTGALETTDLTCTFASILSDYTGLYFGKTDNTTNLKYWLAQPKTDGTFQFESLDDGSTVTGTVTLLRNGGATLAGPLTGTTATMSSNIITNGGYVMVDRTGDAAAAFQYFRTDAGQAAIISIQTGTSQRWTLSKNAVAESGSSAGSNLELYAYDDAGAVIAGGAALSVTRATKAVALTGALFGTTAAFSGTVIAPGALIQMASFQTGTVAAGGTIVPFDNTIPQITEGNEYMTCAITPKSATSKLVITVTAHLLNSTAAAWIIGCLFQDSVANALASSFMYVPVANAGGTLSFTHTMTSGTTSSITFRFRAGSHVAGTTTFNGSGGTQMFGSNLASSIVIREVAV